MAYKFNLPLDSQLTLEQRAALYETEPIAIQGGPGTGKSVVSLRRHINNINSKKKSQLLTYTKTLAKFLEQCCYSADHNKAAMCVGTALSFGGRVDGEIIIDEAQDLPSSILQRFKSNAKIVSFGADDRQQLYPGKGCTISELKSIFPETEDVFLEQNFRNTYSIMNFVKYLFPKKAIPQDMLDKLKHSNKGNKPILLKYSARGKDERINAETRILKELLSDIYSQESNTAILVPFESSVNEYYDMVQGIVSKCSKYHNKMDGIDVIENLHVTTFKSAKGLEFDTVIIPNFGSYQYLVDNYSEKLSEADYYVGLTRARSNLFLLSDSTISVPNTTYECNNI